MSAASGPGSDALAAQAAGETGNDATPGPSPAFVDDRCSRCSEAGKGAYRMVGRCRNCGLAPVLGLHSVSHEATLSGCPVCGTRNVSWQRLATPDEIPADFEAKQAGTPDLDDGRHPDECPCQFCDEDRREAAAQDDEASVDIGSPEDGDYDDCEPTL